MPLAEVTLRQVVCDNCGAPGPAAPEAARAAAEALALDWSCAFEAWFCPDCDELLAFGQGDADHCFVRKVK